MLSDSHFDNSRVELLSQILRGYTPPVAKSVRFEEDLKIDISVYNKVVSYRSSLRDVFLIFCNRIRVIENSPMRTLTVCYPTVDEDDDEIVTEEYSISYLYVNAFMYARLYEHGDLEKQMRDFDNYIMLNPNDPLLLPPITLSIKDEGQLKILTDVILAVEDADLKSGDKVLVVGSAPNVGTVFHRSYDILAYMAPGVEVHLYDPEEVDGYKSIVHDGKKTEFFHYRKKYTLLDEDREKYALYLDDAYIPYHVAKKTRPWDALNYYCSFKNYSVKWFPSYPSYRGNKYDQVFYTQGREFRVVSRPVGEYKGAWDPRLGNCSACKEIKMKLRKTYPPEFYKFFLSFHARNCVTGKMNKRRKAVEYRFAYRIWYASSETKKSLANIACRELNETWLSINTYLQDPDFLYYYLLNGVYYFNKKINTNIAGTQDILPLIWYPIKSAFFDFFSLATDPVEGVPTIRYDPRVKATYKIVASSLMLLPSDIVAYGHVIMKINDQYYISRQGCDTCVYLSHNPVLPIISKRDQLLFG